MRGILSLLSARAETLCWCDRCFQTLSAERVRHSLLPETAHGNTQVFVSGQGFSISSRNLDKQLKIFSLASSALVCWLLFHCGGARGNTLRGRANFGPKFLGFFIKRSRVFSLAASALANTVTSFVERRARCSEAFPIGRARRSFSRKRAHGDI